MSPYRNRAANPVTTATAAVGMPSTHPGPNEPVQDLITPIYTGRHLWSAIRPTTLDALPPPLDTYEEFPFTNSDRTKLPPCTVRWQFTRRFSINREEDVARGSFRVQVRRYLASKSAVNTDCTVNFPRGVGRGRFVEVTVSPENLAILAEAQLVFNGSQLQRPCVGANLPKTSLVIEVLEIPLRNAWSETAADIAILLQSHARVHDIWVARVSNSSNSTPPEDTNKMVVLASLTPWRGWGRRPEVIPLSSRIPQDWRCRMQTRVRWASALVHHLP